MNEHELNGSVAVVTGAGRGIGRAIALELARHGVKVTLAARNATELETVQVEVTEMGGQAAVFPTDVAQEDDVKALIRETARHFGRLDIVVNNAGIGLFGPLAETTTETWDRLMDVNARGTFVMCREAIPHLRKRELSFIINISSVVGVKGYPNQAAYSASKHAVMGMSKALAKEVQADGIRVHAICPGGVYTEMVGQARPDLDPAVLMSPQDIADIVLFLLTRRGNAVIDEVQVRRASSTPWA
jgi:3-oxoacyl-[acyl-carrier protein] reductase